MKGLIMLTSALAELLISNMPVRDDDIAVLEIEQNKKQKIQRRAIVQAMARLRQSLQSLHSMGIQSIENPDHDPDRPDKDYLFIAKDDATRALVRTAFAAGVHCRLLVEQVYESFIVTRDVEKGKKAGRRGGDAKAAKANARKQEIWEAYAQWSNDTANEGKSDAEFCTSFAKKKKKKTGYSKASIQRAIKALHERILDRTHDLAIPPASRRKRAELVAKDMAGEPGISLATVRRALA